MAAPLAPQAFAAGTRLFETAGRNINWFPGHMHSATKAITERIKMVDMVIEVRDARIPLASACGHLEALIQNKKRVIVLNKSDLINPSEQARWAAHLKGQGNDVVFTGALTGSRLGDLLPKALYKRGVIKRLDRTLLMMITGIPNTGKSTLINQLRRVGAARGEAARPNVAITGARPGVTRHVATIQFCQEPPSFLIDTPGVMTPKLTHNQGLKLAVTGAIKHTLVDPVVLCDYLLYLFNLRDQVKYVKGLSLPGRTDDIHEVLEAVCKKNNFKATLVKDNMQAAGDVGGEAA
ncbi:P-loop containing nucleoside triphosphate hydrolase protein, partial [Baffinella frigidus]